MIAFIDDHRQAHGVEPICRVLPIALSTYHAHVAKRVDPSRLSARDRRDAALKEEVRRVFEANFRVYGSARCGGNCSARASMWPAARLPA
jgi:putative transposase